MSTKTGNTRKAESIVPIQSDGIRLDTFLADRFTYQSRTGWQKLIEDGRILVAGHTTRASRKLHAGELVEFLTDGLTEPDVDTKYTIIAEYPQFLAINKPAQLPVHPAGCYFRNTLLMLLQEERGCAFHVVNRLDRETSGIVLLAKSPAAAKSLAGLFLKGAIQKTYTAAVHGKFPEERQICNGWLIPDIESAVNKKRRYTEDASLAVPYPEAEDCSTEFTLMEYKDGISIVRCEPHTGRLHQIRATLCSNGFPLVGDKLYGLDDTLYLRFIESKLTEEDNKTLILDRQALHAAELHFISPFDHASIDLCAPADFPDTLLQR